MPQLPATRPTHQQSAKTGGWRSLSKAPIRDDAAVLVSILQVTSILDPSLSITSLSETVTALLSLSSTLFPLPFQTVALSNICTHQKQAQKQQQKTQQKQNTTQQDEAQTPLGGDPYSMASSTTSFMMEHFHQHATIPTAVQDAVLRRLRQKRLGCIRRPHDDRNAKLNEKANADGLKACNERKKRQACSRIGSASPPPKKRQRMSLNKNQPGRQMKRVEPRPRGHVVTPKERQTVPRRPDISKRATDPQGKYSSPRTKLEESHARSLLKDAIQNHAVKTNVSYFKVHAWLRSFP